MKGLRIRIGLTAAVGAAAAAFPWGALASRGVVTVIASGFVCDAGVARVALFRGAAGFPEDFSRAYKTAEVEVKGGEARVVFADVEYGNYAVVVLHDANRNGVRDRNFFRVPVEAIGVSGNAPATRTAPSYDDCVVSVYTTEERVEISMQN